jgi:hypothetical protein
MAPVTAFGEIRVSSRRVPLLLLLTWGALLLNVLAFLGVATVLPIPRAFGQLVTQGALPLALLLALLINPRAVVRPNLFLVLLSMLAVGALMVSIHNSFMVGSTFRAVRLAVFVLILWLLTPWWGHRDMLLLRCHRFWLWVAVGSVVMGAVIAPGTAFSFEGRLAGVLWPIPATQVAHYAAVLFGTTVILWMCRLVSGWQVPVGLFVSGLVLVGTHTRTALLGAVAGLLIAGASLFVSHLRVRRTSAMSVVVAILVATLFAPQIAEWLRRGQTAEEAGALTGRTTVWSAVLDSPRPRVNELFGSGLSNQSFQGLAIDSNWVATFLDQGWYGILVQVSFLLVLVFMAVTHVRGPRRAISLFLIVYCVVASITETGLGSPSPYLLDLTVAASLLVRPARTG